MRNLLLTLLSLTLAGLAVLGLFLWPDEDRSGPTAGGPPPVADAPGGTSLAVQGGEPGSRALLAGGDAPDDAGAEDLPRDAAGAPDTEEADPLTAARLAQVEERFRREARVIAEALEMTAEDEARLYGVLLDEYRRRADYFEELRKDAFDPEARARVREELAAIQQWKTEELQAQIGAELAVAVQDFERRTDRGLFRNFERESKERNED